MRRFWTPLIAFAALAGPAFAQQAGVAPPLVLPPADDSPPPYARPLIVTDRTGEVVCGARPVEPVTRESLPPLLREQPLQTFPDAERSSPLVLTFDVDPDGRPVSIRPAPDAPQPGYVVSVGIQASLASWRFAPGARRGCRLTVTDRPLPVEAASPALLATALAIGEPGGRFAPRLRRALQRPGDDCLRSPQVRTIGYPRTSSSRPGGRDFVVTRISIRPDGSTGDVEVLAASGDPAFRDDVERAQRETTFQPGRPREGCVSFRGSYSEATVPAPETDPKLLEQNRCTAEHFDRLTLGTPGYPDAFETRGIEGWAVVKYDVASWGRVGGVEVLAAEPAMAFGDAARAVFNSASAAPGFSHVAGCVRRISFRMPEDRDAPAAGDNANDQ